MENPIEEFKRLHEFYGSFDYRTKELAEYIGEGCDRKERKGVK